MRFKIVLAFEDVRFYDPLVVDDWIEEVVVDASNAKSPRRRPWPTMMGMRLLISPNW
jgi:hypothetical protein